MAKKTAAVDAKGFRKFGMRDKLAYAAGDFACNMSFALKSYMMIYWTQFMKLDSYIYAILLVVCQVWDAINDPLVGTMIDADRHKYRRNKFLQYIWIGSIGLIVAGALCFLPFPNLGNVVKGILFICGYVFWDAFYTVANVPYGSMLPLITEEPGERAQLSSWRTAGSLIAGMATGVLIPILIYDASNNLKGESLWIIALIMGVVGFIFFQLLLRFTTIRVDLDLEIGEEPPKFDLFKSIGNFCKNRPAVGATLAACAMFLGMYGAGTASTVMFQAYFKNAQVSGLMTLVGFVPMFFFMPFIAKIVRKFGKQEASAFGILFSVLACVLMLVLPIGPNGTGMLIYVVCQLLNGLGGGIYQCVSYSMMADAIDYNEWKFGARDEGTIYSLHSFFRKLAQGVGPSIGLVIATALGYVAAMGADQTPEVALTMRYLVAAFYLFAAVLQYVGVKFVYNLDKKTLTTMTEELDAKRAQ
ncbi:MAG: MFS transporter [Lachnospiraceae bacterium]|nr:MFS transporter [Lachnospiraceae bacterium]